MNHEEKGRDFDEWIVAAEHEVFDDLNGNVNGCRDRFPWKAFDTFAMHLPCLNILNASLIFSDSI